MRNFGNNLPIRAERILWLCVLLDRFLGMRNFNYVRMLQSGMPSIVHAPALQKASIALHNLRLLRLGMDTPAGVNRAIDDYVNFHYTECTQGEYEIDLKNKTFAPANGFGSDLIDRLEILLSAPFEHNPCIMPWADSYAEMTATVQLPDGAASIALDPLRISLPTPRYHDLTRRAKEQIKVPVPELFAIAKEMDQVDGERSRERKGMWHMRLSMAVIKQCNDGGLVDTDTLVLSQCKHLIGVPGVGKTSLLMVLAVWLARNKKKTMLVFPTVEVSRQYKSDLHFYGANVAMLVGQSDLTLRRHQERNAETVAAKFGHGGFGGKIEATEDFAASCVLRAYSRNAAEDWKYGYAPCHQIKQHDEEKNRPIKKLCPAFTACGRKKAVRELVDADVWVGHIRSMDTSLNAYTSVVDMQYFEYIARHFDVVIFDEADKVQSDLDAMAANKLQIIGDDVGLVDKKIGEIISKLVSTSSQRLDHRAAQEFGIAGPAVISQSVALNGVLQSMLRQPDQSKAAQHFNGQLLTAQKMLIDIMGGFGAKADDYDGEEAATRFARNNAIIELWDSVAYTAHMESVRHNAATWRRSAFVASALNMPIEEVERIYAQLHGYLRTYRASNYLHERHEVVGSIASVLARLCFGEKEVEPILMAGLRLLAPITMLILGYRDLVLITSRLPLDASVVDFADKNMSAPLARYLPESLAGPLSGLKYQLIPAKNKRDGEYVVELEYATVKNVPRMYMHNFHDMFATEGVKHGPAVLMVSATSFLEDSPSFHIDCGPHYVLQRAQPEATATKSFWRFRPVKNPRRNNQGKRYLMYSGGGDQRMENLKLMVDGFLGDDIEKAEVFKDIRNFDVRDGIPRKAAFIVNSYEQVRLIKQYINLRYPQIGARTKAVIDYLQADETNEHYVTTAQVETIGDDRYCDIVIFPMAALQRGINIVHTSGPRKGHAALGHLYFLTRPHPSSDDMQFLLGLIGKSGQDFANRQFSSSDSIDLIETAYVAARKAQYKQAWQILREPVRATRLPLHLYRQFVANLMVMILQTTGRGTRGNCPVVVNFVDAAWAPNSAMDMEDTAKTSMLVMMRRILEDCVAHENPLHREIYQILYGEFLQPLRNIESLRSGDGGDSFCDDDFYYFDDDQADGE